uniref:CCHC-type domain-containing protein n=1 Tax=Oryzias latipes TaxID=8090 RepID=A0A3B3I5P6_ORYLA
MDPADADSSRSEFSSQEKVLRQQEEQMNYLRRGMLEMANRQEQQLIAIGGRIDQRAQQLQQPSPVQPSSSASAPMAASQTSFAPTVPLARPERFSGASGDCRVFITQCELNFELQAAAYPTDRAKVAFIVSHLTDRAAAWATAEWQRGSASCASLPAFLEAFTQVFQHTRPGREAARALMRLRQGRRRVADYAIDFRTLAAESAWNPSALIDAFLEGLSGELKDQLAPLDLPATLEGLIALAIRIDNRLQDRRRERRSDSSSPGGGGGDPAPHLSDIFSVPIENPTLPLEEPMCLGRGLLSSSERKRRMTAGECLYCGKRGHFCKDCPKATARH